MLHCTLGVSFRSTGVLIYFMNIQNIQILEMYFAKQYKIFLIVTISLILIYYTMVVLIMDLILILKYLKQYIQI